MKQLFECCMPKEKPVEEGDFSTFFNVKTEPKEKNSTGNLKVKSKNQKPGISFKENNTEYLDNTIQNVNPSVDANIERQRMTTNFGTNQYNGNQNISNSNTNLMQNNLVNISVNNENLQQVVTDIEVQSNKKLELVELEGNTIVEKKLLINAGGLVKGSLRNAKDGWTYFGLVKKDRYGNVINDYILNMQSKVNVNTIFKVFFEREKQKYFLSCENAEDDLIIVFVKLEKPFKLFKKHIISLGEIHLSVEVDQNTNLKLEMVYGNEETKSKTFSKGQGKVVRIGRNRDNEIVLENYAFSRVHTSFWYSPLDDCWHVQDGVDSKTSTNGTWLYLDWNWPIETKTFFRIGTNFMYLNYVS